MLHNTNVSYTKFMAVLLCVSLLHGVFFVWLTYVPTTVLKKMTVTQPLTISFVEQPQKIQLKKTHHQAVSSSAQKKVEAALSKRLPKDTVKTQKKLKETLKKPTLTAKKTANHAAKKSTKKVQAISQTNPIAKKTDVPNIKKPVVSKQNKTQSKVSAPVTKDYEPFEALLRQKNSYVTSNMGDDISNHLPADAFTDNQADNQADNAALNKTNNPANDNLHEDKTLLKQPNVDDELSKDNHTKTNNAQTNDTQTNNADTNNADTNNADTNNDGLADTTLAVDKTENELDFNIDKQNEIEDLILGKDGAEFADTDNRENLRKQLAAQSRYMATAKYKYKAPKIYPAKEWNNNQEGIVMIEFVINEVGRADPNSLNVVSATTPNFETAAKNVVLQSTFYISEVENQPVKQFVKTIIDFRLDEN